jgi:hypothetical protein
MRLPAPSPRLRGAGRDRGAAKGSAGPETGDEHTRTMRAI